jgi:hypothetical protein
MIQFAIFLLAAVTLISAKERFSEDLFKALKYRNIGPFRGGRSAAAAGVPGNKFLALFGGTAGGVWQTKNGGQSWKNLSDEFFGGSI